MLFGRFESSSRSAFATDTRVGAEAFAYVSRFSFSGRLERPHSRSYGNAGGGCEVVAGREAVEKAVVAKTTVNLVVRSRLSSLIVGNTVPPHPASSFA